MNLLLLGPNKSTTGNSVTLSRLSSLFSGVLGWTVHLVDVLDDDALTLLTTLLPSAHVIVALHGYHSGRLLQGLPAPPAAPVVLVLAGTDVAAPSAPGVVAAAATAAAAVVGFSEALLEQLIALCRGGGPPLHRRVCIPQAVGAPAPLAVAPCVRGALSLAPGAPLALLVAGLREVKDPLFALSAFAALHGRLAAAGAAAAELPALLVVGPPLDAGVAARVRGAAGVAPGAPFGGRGGVFVHPPVPRAQLLAWLAQADAALNTSRSEGQCGALLEAMAVGTPVAARCAEGNRALVAHGATGLLFDTPDSAVAALAVLLGLPAGGGGGSGGGWPLPGRTRPLRTVVARALAVQARAYVAAHHSDEGEAAAWRELLVAVAASGEPPAPPAPPTPTYQRHALLRLPSAQRRASSLVASALRWVGDHEAERLGPVVAPPTAAPATAAFFAAGLARAWGAPGDADDARWPAAPYVHDFGAPGAAAAASVAAGAAAEALLAPPPHLAGPDGAPHARLGWGRFAEDRVIYTSAHFSGPEGGGRSFHLGVDLEAPAGTPVLAPLSGRVHSVGVDASELGYGPTVVLEHVLRVSVAHDDGVVGEEAVVFYTLYGHLSRASVFGADGAPRLALGAAVAAGAVLGAMGSPVGGENGGWWPHVHFQVMTELRLGGWRGDYPGVCALGDWAAYSELMLDPNMILRCPWVAPVGWAPGVEEGAWRPRVLAVRVGEEPHAQTG